MTNSSKKINKKERNYGISPNLLLNTEKTRLELVAGELQRCKKI